MKPYLIIIAEIMGVVIIASLMPLALYSGGEIYLAQMTAYVFGAIVIWFSIVMIHLEYKFQKGQKENKLQRAHHLGFTHGLKEGVENNPFEDDMERHMYRIGYDAGVSEYCRVAHPEG